MAKKLEILKALVLSTAHVPKHTADALENQEWQQDLPMNVVNTGHSYRIYVMEGSAVFNTEEMADHPQLVALARLANENHCTWLELDQDGSINDDLPNFDW